MKMGKKKTKTADDTLFEFLKKLPKFDWRTAEKEILEERKRER